MKKLALIPIFVLLGASAVLSASPAQDKPGQTVTVTAVEVPVRVLLKGEPVKGLTKADFEVYENGVLQEITGFEAISRRISPERAISAATRSRFRRCRR
mgnify:CR=1 FL=1